ncbi:hypothetical protein B5G52_15350 [Pseudoalteromonas sp. A601]|uniref:hypothetical protein n=1 Tax=Pseudoalteromonas sp. A601 TaxID=1967839 RepID=UPI000B3CC94E|nr:hypothetical protein [Pseudoalteromonas sp. A601]OUS70198.1 hypothetical protein B5G52_15350 [Pseudoalteromonas sp. A601]
MKLSHERKIASKKGIVCRSKRGQQISPRFSIDPITTTIVIGVAAAGVTIYKDAFKPTYKKISRRLANKPYSEYAESKYIKCLCKQSKFSGKLCGAEAMLYETTLNDKPVILIRCSKVKHHVMDYRTGKLIKHNKLAM